jgi:hypothetical protein
MTKHARYAELPNVDDLQLLEILSLRWVEAWRVISALDREGRTEVIHFEELRDSPDAAVARAFAWLGHQEEVRARIPRLEPRPRGEAASEVGKCLRLVLNRAEQRELEID